MSRNKLIAAVLVGGVALPTVLWAQPQRNAKEFVEDEYQIVQSKKHMARDQAEIKDFQELLEQMHVVRLNDPAEYNSLSEQLRSAMKREHAQAQAKLSQAGREVRQSWRERREAVATASVADHVQRADDRRDLRDDHIDRAAAGSRTNRMQSLIGKSNALQPAIGQGHEEAMVRNRRLMGEFLELMRADLRATASELGEDRRERREDRHERLSDGRK